MQLQYKPGAIEHGVPGVGWENAAGSLAVVVAGLESMVDLATSVDLNVSILYSIPLVLAALARNRRLLWGLTLALVCSTVGVYWLQAVQGQAAASTPLLINRLLAASCLLLSASVLSAWMGALDKLVMRERAIEQKNETLEAMNHQLIAKELEIGKQNEELNRRRLEAEEASVRKTQMLASLSHDIRSPIQAISLLSELVSRTAERPELAAKIPPLAQRLRTNAVSVVDFLSEVIDLASFDSGRVVLNPSEFSLEGLINEQCQRLSALAEAKGLELQADVAADQTWLLTDRVKLGRVVGNLINNAIKFTQHGNVTVSCGRDPTGTVFVRVSDTGCGIKEDEIANIFGEYAQLRPHPTREHRASGWGLGLAISRRMSRLLGGDISVQSQVGVGSTFLVRLPSSCLVPRQDTSNG